ncbi:MAG TPA: LysR family transcriptional regulator, partial [Sphingopyxis sp.]|nr:LysR family transcriptional regulator [Sphingopyxis sp.]
MQDLNDLYLFVQAVDHGGFAAAARALGMQKSKLSRRIGLLEERLGVRLIQRSTRRFSVTEIGREYYRHCVAMLVEAEAAQTVVDQSRAAPRGVIRLSCPTGLIAFQFGDLFGRFMALHPDVELHVASTNRRVDVIGEGFDLAIRVRPPPIAESELVMRRFDERTIRIVASPALLRGRSIAAPADLAGLPSLDFGPAGGEHR